MPPKKRAKSAKSKLTRALALRTPEIKDVVLVRNIAQLNNLDINASGVFAAIEQGPLGSNRIGDRIRVLSIEVCGRVWGLEGVSTFSMVCPKDASRPPLLTDYGAAIGGQYDLSRGWSLHHSLRDPAALAVLQETNVFKFPLGMVVCYNPPSEGDPNSVNKNEVYACHINRTGANTTGISYTIRVKFVDA